MIKHIKLLSLISLIMVAGIVLFGANLWASEEEDTEDQIPPATGLEDTEDLDDLEIATVTPDHVLFFVVDTRWGHVRGEDATGTETGATGSAATNFDGSISVSGGRVVLLKTLLFEKHNDTADKVTSTKNPVSWNSLIYNHWDGVRAWVIAPASSNVTITTTQGSITKTAKELYELREPLLRDVGAGREIVVKTHPRKHRHFFLKVLWGKVGEDSAATDTRLYFNGSLTVNGGTKIKLKETLRFESAFRCARTFHELDIEAKRLCREAVRDRIVNHSRTSVEWQSLIEGGVDGILLRVNLEKGVAASDTLTLKFSEFGFEKTYSILDLWQNDTTKETISVEGATGYGAVLSVWDRSNGALIRVKGKPEVFRIEDGKKEHVNSAEVFNAHKLEWDDIEEVSEEEAASYAEGEPLAYPDGTVLKGSGPKVYVVTDGKKRHFVSPRAFEGLGYEWGLIKNVPDSELTILGEGDAVTETSSHPEGALVRVEGTPTVWLIEGGKRKPVPGLAVFYAHKFDWQNVLVTDVSHGNRFSQGEDVAYPDGSLLSGPDGRVYLIDKAKKRWIRSALDLVKAGYDWDDIETVSHQDLTKYQEGDTVVGEDVR